jgi:hypothetical protein
VVDLSTILDHLPTSNLIAFHSCISLVNIYIEVKVKFTLYQAMKAHMGSRGIALPFL